MSQPQESQVISLTLNRNQYSAMVAFFADNDWDIENLICGTSTYTQTAEAVINDQNETSQAGVLIPRNENANECPFCLCAPCVISECHKQDWWPEHRCPPKQRNIAKRKILYQKFWSMLSHRGIWTESRYLARKEDAIITDRQRHTFVWHTRGYVRELMPDCVITQVRQWLPNPVGIAYVGHLWR